MFGNRTTKQRVTLRQVKREFKAFLPKFIAFLQPHAIAISIPVGDFMVQVRDLLKNLDSYDSIGLESSCRNICGFSSHGDIELHLPSSARAEYSQYMDDFVDIMTKNSKLTGLK